MITKVTKISQGCGTYKARVEGQDLTREEILNNRDIRYWSTFGANIVIYNDGTEAEVNCYYD